MRTFSTNTQNGMKKLNEKSNKKSTGKFPIQNHLLIG